MSVDKYLIEWRHAETGELQERSFDDPEDADAFLRTVEDGRYFILFADGVLVENAFDDGLF